MTVLATEESAAVSAFKRATRRMAELQEQVTVQAARRREAIGTLRESGWSLQQIGDAVGVSKGQIARLERGD